MQIFAPLNSEPIPVLQQVEVATFFQLPGFQIIGLPAPEVAESRERIRSAIDASGLTFPKRRVVLNLSPASIRKKGTGLDLAMALAVLGAGKELAIRLAAWGELGLDGSVKPVGQLTRTLYAAWKEKLSHIVLAESEYSDSICALNLIRSSGEMEGAPPLIIPVRTLGQGWSILSSSSDLEILRKDQSDDHTHRFPSSRGLQEEDLTHLLPISPSMERLIGIAAAGNHHILLLGPRGSGKSHTLEWLIALQPPITAKDHLKQILLAELSQFPTQSRIRRVSSQVRPGALVGGASSATLRPGEFSLAHGGLLIADELPEWHRDSIEALREPLERGCVTLTRTQRRLELPAQFLLAANGNFCPCGGWPSELPFPMDLMDQERKEKGKKEIRCRCSDSARRQYRARLSGPFLDRVDLVVLVSPFGRIPPNKNKKVGIQASSRIAHLRDQVITTREKLIRRWGSVPGLLTGSEVENIFERYPNGEEELAKLSGISLRSRHKIIRVALSICAWENRDHLSLEHFSEAACYRPEKTFWTHSQF